MNEQTHTPRERAAGGGGLGGIFDDGLGDDGLVTVSSGPYAEQLPVANLTVGEIRGRFRDRFDIDPRSQAVLAGNEVGDETVVRPGQLLMFVRRAGEKGMQQRVGVPPTALAARLEPGKSQALVNKSSRLRPGRSRTESRAGM